MIWATVEGLLWLVERGGWLRLWAVTSGLACGLFVLVGLASRPGR